MVAAGQQARSLALELAALPLEIRREVIDSLSPETALALKYDWEFWARPNQLAPEMGARFAPLVPRDWRIWLILAGRGFGKTRSGAEWVMAQVSPPPGAPAHVAGRRRRIALISSTVADVRDTMILGESGLIEIAPPWFKPVYRANSGKLIWPNGAVAKIYSAEKPGRLRGPQHDGAWADEICAWQYPEETWDMLMLGLRLGTDPQVVVTTTPKPIPVLIGDKPRGGVRRGILNEEDVGISKGSSYDNVANLPGAYTRQILSMYEGTRLGAQELWAEILDDNPNALWKRALIEAKRTRELPLENERIRVVVAVDPAVSVDGAPTADEMLDTSGKKKRKSNETGIVCALKAMCNCKGPGKAELHAFVFMDNSGHYTPGEWADKVVLTYQLAMADRIVVERNQGGDLVESNLRTHPQGANLPITTVWAKRGKILRAEPVAGLYERGMVHHVGTFGMLEDQMCQWNPSEEESPDRLDACVYALTELMLGEDTAELPEEDVPISGRRM